VAAQSSVSLVGRARFRLRTHMIEHPVMYLPLARVKRALRLDVRDIQRQVISPRTELVIEGYTRCGSTFAVYALQLSQERPVRLAHHWHAPAQLIEAAHRKIPALLVIRRPEEAILSQLIREPNLTLRDALVAYSRFYECLLPYRHSFVVGEFEQVTHDFGLLIRRLNARFGTSFAEFVHSEANVRECLELMKLRGTLSKTLFGFESGEVSLEQLEWEVQSVGGAKLLDARDVWDTKDAWVPSEDRTRAKTALREQWLQQPSLAKLRERAQLVYQAHVDGT
jgi:hypothetical protein